MSTCKVRGCKQQSHSRGFCQRHYAQWRNYGLIDADGKQLRKPNRVPLKYQKAKCRQPECDNEVRTRGWCNKHYLQFRHGILDENGKQLRDPKFRPGRGWRSYCRGYRKVMSKGHPHADRDGYVLEHRLVVEKQLGRYLEPHELVHHINGVKDDNRPENLQIRTRKKHPPAHETPVSFIREALEHLKLNDPVGYAELLKELQ